MCWKSVSCSILVLCLYRGMHIYLDSVGMNEKINNCDGLKNGKWQFVRDEELEMLWSLKVVMQLLVHMHQSLHAFPWLLNVVNENTVECTSIFNKDRELNQCTH